MSHQVENWLVGFRLAAIACAIALALAPLDWPYGYYQLLRIGATSAAIWLAVEAHKESQPGWRATGVILAFIFNPVQPLAFDRDVWAWIDWGAAGVFLAAAFAVPRELQHKDPGSSSDGKI